MEVVAWAASNGDRSENADYLYGKRRLGQIDSRIRFLTKRIDAAVVVDPAARRADEGEPRRPCGPARASEDGASRDHRRRVRADSDGSFSRTARSSVDAQGQRLLDQAARL